MKKAFVFILATMISLPAFSQKTLREGMQQIKDRYGVTFIYGSGIDLDREYTGKPLPGKTLRKDLFTLFEDTGIDVSIKKNQVILKKKKEPAPRPETSLSEVQLLDSAKIVDWQRPLLSHPSAGALGISDHTVKTAPVILGERDVLKTLQMLPGVQAATEGFSGLSVRGGYADQNLVLLDGVPFSQAEHAFGLFSAFPAESVSGATLYKGDFPARYGGRMSSVLAMESSPGNADSLRWGFSVGLIADKIHADGPLGDKFRFSVAGRALHTVLAEPVLALLPEKANYWFYDIHARLDYKAGRDDNIFLSVYNGQDWYRTRYSYVEYSHRYDGNYAAYNDWTTNSDSHDLRWGTTSASLHWEHGKSGRTVLSWRASGMHTLEKSFEQINTDDIHLLETTNASSGSSGEYEALLKTDWSSGIFNYGAWASRHTFNTGGVYSVNKKTLDSAILFDSRDTYVSPESMSVLDAGAYVGADIVLGHGFSLAPGLRLSLFRSLGTTFVNPEPRFMAEWSDSTWSFGTGYSRMVQYYHRIPAGYTMLPTDVWRPASASVPPARGNHYSVNALYKGLPGWDFSVELYLKTMSGVAEYLQEYAPNGSAYSDWADMVASGEGAGYGAEFLLRKTSGLLTGWLGYTLSRSEMVFPDGSINGGVPYPASTDRRHRINIFVSYAPGEHIDMALAWTFASGAPVTAPERYCYVEREMTATNRNWLQSGYYSSGRNSFRLPPVHRADFSINFHKPCRRGTRTWTFGLYNLYGAQNPDFVLLGWTQAAYPDRQGYHPELPEGTLYLDATTVLMFIPTISFTRDF